MSNRPQVLIDVERELGVNERSLIKQRSDIREFVRTEHTAKDNLERQAAVAKSENELAALLDILLENKNVSVEFRVQANELCDHCRALNQYTRDMFTALDADLIERRRVEDAKTEKPLTVAETAFLLGLPLSVVSAVNAGLGRNHITANQGAAAGFAISASFVFRKKIGKVIRGGFGGVRNTPALLRKGATVIYYSPVAMDGRIGVRLAFESGANAISIRAVKTAARMKELAVKVGRLKGPRP